MNNGYKAARQVIRYALHHFYDQSSGMFWYAAREKRPTIQPKTEITDNVIPSSNSAMALVLEQAGIYFENDDFSEIAKKMTEKIYPALLKNLPYFSTWALLLNSYPYPTQEVVFTGKQAVKLSREFE